MCTKKTIVLFIALTSAGLSAGEFGLRELPDDAAGAPAQSFRIFFEKPTPGAFSIDNDLAGLIKDAWARDERCIGNPRINEDVSCIRLIGVLDTRGLDKKPLDVKTFANQIIRDKDFTNKRTGLPITNVFVYSLPKPADLLDTYALTDKQIAQAVPVYDEWATNFWREKLPADRPTTSELWPMLPDLTETEPITLSTFAELIRAAWQRGEPYFFTRIKSADTFDRHAFDYAEMVNWLQHNAAHTNPLTSEQIQKAIVFQIKRPEVPAGVREFTDEQLRNAPIFEDEGRTREIQAILAPAPVALPAPAPRPEPGAIGGDIPADGHVTDIEQIRRYYHNGKFDLHNKGITVIDGRVFQQIAAESGPEQFFYLLQNLDLHENNLSALPPEIGLLANLRILAVSYNRQLAALPPEVWQLRQLSELYLNSTRFAALPPEIGQLVNLRKLYLGYTLIAALPTEIGRLANLDTLGLSGMLVPIALPAEIRQLRNLRELSLAGARIAVFPEKITGLENLKELYICETNINALPPTIRRLSNLEKLDIRFTNLATLPPEIDQLVNLQTLRVRGTPLVGTPEWPERKAQLLDARERAQRENHDLPALRIYDWSDY